MKLGIFLSLVLTSAALAGGDTSIAASDATTYWTDQALTSTTGVTSSTYVGIGKASAIALEYDIDDLADGEDVVFEPLYRMHGGNSRGYAVPSAGADYILVTGGTTDETSEIRRLDPDLVPWGCHEVTLMVTTTSTATVRVSASLVAR